MTTKNSESWAGGVPAAPTVKDVLTIIKAAQLPADEQALHEHLHDVLALIGHLQERVSQRDAELTARGKALDEREAKLRAGEREVALRAKALDVAKDVLPARKGWLR